MGRKERWKGDKKNGREIKGERVREIVKGKRGGRSRNGG